MSKYKQLMLMVPGLEKQENKTDFYRSLSVQGVYQTVCVAEKIKEDSCGYPEFIFSPPTLYVRQTAEIIQQTFPKAQLVLLDNLYAANEQNLLHFLMHLDEIFECLLILNESFPIQKFAEQLTGQIFDLSPSACLCIQWPAHQTWKKIDTTTGRLIRQWMP